MIRIIKGTYGYFDGKKVVPKTAGDGFFSLASEKEESLVRLGIAEYEDERTKPQERELMPLDKMSLSDLKALALTYGVDASKERSKSAVIKLIEDAGTSSDDEVDDATDVADDEPPQLGAALPIGGNGDA